MKIRTIHDGLHNKVIVSYDGEWFEPQEYCGDSWCNGECGYPALVLKHHIHNQNLELKTHSNMVAYGQAFQEFRVKWIGEKVYIPKSAGSSEELFKIR